MKATFFIPIIAALVTGACSSSYHASSGNDDLYYTPGKNGKDNTNTATVSTPNQTSVKKTQEPLSDYEKYRLTTEEAELDSTKQDQGKDGDTRYYSDNKRDKSTPDAEMSTEEYYGDGRTVVNNYYLDDDYYYASRIRRFHSPYYGWGYYDPFYTDPYWYGGGWSISIGWSWGYPSYGYYDPFYNPYYYGYGYRPYYAVGYYSGWPYWTSHHHYGGYYDGGYYHSGRNYTYGRIPNRSSNSRTNQYYGVSRRSSDGSSYTTRTKSMSSDNSGRTGRRDGSSQVYTRRAGDAGSSSSGNENVQSGRRGENNSGSSRTYTPSYSKPRTYSRPAYNESGSSRSDGSSVNTSSGRRGSSESSSSSGSGRSYDSSRSSGGSSRSSGGSYSGGGSSRSSGGSYSGGGSSRSSGGSYSGGGSSRSSGSSGSSSSSSGSSSSGSGRRR